MRKLLVKIFNLIYLAGSAVAIWALVTKPIVNTEVGVSLTSDQVADKLIEIFNSKSGGGGEGESKAPEYKLSYREESSEKDQMVTREDIKAAFPEGFSLKVGIKIEAKDAFDFNNKELLKKSVAESIDRSLTAVIGSVTDGLHNLIVTVTEKIAKEELAKQINEQITTYFEGATPVTEEEVQAVFDNVKEAINSDEPCTVDNLATTIVGEKDPETGEYPEGTLLYLLEEKKKETGTGLIYAAADPQPTSQAEVDEGTYFFKVEGDNPETEATEEVYYVSATEYLLGSTYYVEKYDATDVSGEDIADKLAEALGTIPGLVEEKREGAQPTESEFNATVHSTRHYYSPEGVNAKTFVLGGVYDSGKTYYTIMEILPQPNQATVEAELSEVAANRHFVVKTSEGYAFPTEYSAETQYYYASASEVDESEYYQTAASDTYKVKVVGEDRYEFAKQYSAEEEYFIEQKYVNNVDDALAKLIEQMLNGGGSSEGGEGGEPSKAHLRLEGEEESKSSQEELEEALKEYIYKMLPLDNIYKVTEQADQYSTYVALGLIGLCVFPWALFALVTLIRTLRRKKCWTKPWIVFVFAFFQLIFGLVLTYGLKYALPLVKEHVPQVAEYIDQLGLSVGMKFGVLIPSFIYAGMIVLTIPYIIIAHRLKVEYKLEKRALKMEMYKKRQQG